MLILATEIRRKGPTREGGAEHITRHGYPARSRLRFRKRLALGITTVLITVVVWFPACGGGDGVVDPGPDSVGRTHQVTLTGIGAEESETVSDASVDGLSVLGTIPTVSP